MDKEAFEDLLKAEPFHPFRINTNGGQAYEVYNPSLVHQLKTQVFFAFPDSDRFALIPLRNISSVEILEQAA
jgi:hypothetical protein